MPEKKRSRKDPATLRNLVGYTDESGNTGKNLFDDAQPYFWTGTVISSEDLDAKSAELAKNLRKILGVKELHGKDLRFQGIGRIALKLLEFIEENDCTFLFTRIEKEHIATIRLAEMLFDSDYNKAVSPWHDLNRIYRRMLTVPVATSLYKRDRRDFWKAYQEGNVGLFTQVLSNLQLRISQEVKDERERQLLLEPIGWALSHPSEVFRPLVPCTDSDSIDVPDPSDLDSPNLVAMLQLVNGLHNILLDKHAKVFRFYHDTQNEFSKAMKDTFEIIKNVHLPKNELLVKRVRTIQAQLEFFSSVSSFGLQLADVCLWLMTRLFKNSPGVEGQTCLPLLATIIKRAIIKEYTYDQLVSETQKEVEEIMARPLTPEAEKRGRQIQEMFEKRRIKRMSQTSDDI